MSVRGVLVRRLPLLLLAVLLGGCRTAYTFKVDALSNPEAVAQAGTSYVLVSGDPSMRPGDLRFEEAARLVRAALSSRGWFEAPDAASADMVVELAFGIGPPTTDYRTYSEPVVEQRGGGSRVAYTTVTNPDGTTTVRPVVVYDPPRREVVGTRTQSVPVTVYEKYLRLSASERREPGEGSETAAPELWSVVVTSRDESEDLRRYLPMMAAAAMPHVGQSTESETEVRVSPDDDAVAFVRRGF